MTTFSSICTFLSFPLIQHIHHGFGYICILDHMECVHSFAHQLEVLGSILVWTLHCRLCGEGIHHLETKEAVRKAGVCFPFEYCYDYLFTNIWKE